MTTGRINQVTIVKEKENIKSESHSSKEQCLPSISFHSLFVANLSRKMLHSPEKTRSGSSFKFDLSLRNMYNNA